MCIGIVFNRSCIEVEQIDFFFLFFFRRQWMERTIVSNMGSFGMRIWEKRYDIDFWMDKAVLGIQFWQVCIDLAVTRANLSTQEVESPDQEGNSFTQNSSLAEPPPWFCHRYSERVLVYRLLTFPL